MQPSNENGQNYWQPQEGDTLSALPPQNIPQTPPVQTQETPAETVSWEASESIHHEHDGMWFVGFIGTISALLGLSIWLQQWTFTALIVIMAVALIIYTHHKPRILRYSLSSDGLHIDQQIYGFNEFRSFGVSQESALFSIMLMPTKRFGQALTIYFSENEGEKIIDILGAYLPMEDLHLDFMDRLLRRLRL